MVHSPQLSADLARSLTQLARALLAAARSWSLYPPEHPAIRASVSRLADAIRTRRPIISVSPSLGYVLVTAIGRLIGDVVLTRDEIKGLMADLLVTNSPPVGSTKLTEWAKANADSLGKHYASELARRKNRDRSRVVRD